MRLPLQNHESERQARTGRRRGLTRLALGCLFVASCAGPALHAARPIPVEASRALGEARRLQRLGLPGAREEAELAERLAPDWVAPRRLLDDLLVADLLLPRAMMAHRAQLAANPRDGGAHYLSGRIEDLHGEEHFWKALELDPSLGWAYHGIATRASQKEDWELALQFGRLALEHARDPNERGEFLGALARYMRRAKQHLEAIELLMQALGFGEAQTPREELTQADTLLAEDRLRLRVDLALSELSCPERDLQERGFLRSVRLIREEEIDDGRLLLLRSRASFVASADRRPELQLALARQDSPARRQLEAGLLKAEDSALAFRLEVDSLGEDAAAFGLSGGLREEGFRHGDPRRLIEAWLSLQPSVVLAQDGLPKRPQLRELVLAARAWPGREVPGIEPHAALIDALIGAGWFREGCAFASSIPGGDSQAALAAYRRASAHEAWIEGLARLTKNIDSGRSRLAGEGDLEASLEESGGVQIETLDDLLVAAESLRDELSTSLGSAVGARPGPDSDLSESPSIAYGPLGEVIHPGPRFSRQDERLGLGVAGEPVPGLAAQLDACGRFGIFGSFLGGGAPDGTLLRLVYSEQRAGQHLGRSWSGTVAWCEGTDLGGRAARSGASIGGAALHEGYYVDIEPLRDQLGIWEGLRARFTGPGSARLVRRALSEAALRPEPLRAGRPDDAAARAAERETTVLLGVTDRIRLSILRDRGLGAPAIEGEAALGAIELDDLIELTAVHEEGHLCDRGRFYPIGRNLRGALALVVEGLFRPEGMMGYLEYRAELIALCEVREPRLVLTQVLSAREEGFSSATPHGSAYLHLLADFVRELDRMSAAAPEAFPGLDRERILVQQLHRLDGEQVRAVARSLAAAEGLIGR